MEMVMKIARVYKGGLPAALSGWKRVALPCAVLAVWQGVTAAGLVKPILLPAPQDVLQAFLVMAGSGELATHLAASFVRVLEGFALAAVLGVGLGLALGIFPSLSELMGGVIELIRPIPPLAWLPLAILWFGIEEGSKVFIIALGAFFPIFTNVFDGVRQTDQKFVELARVLAVPRGKFIAQVILPGALPCIMTGLRVGLAFAWMCVVAAELSAGMKGVGYMLTDSRALAQTDKVVVGMLAIGVVGKMMDGILHKVEKRIVRWKVSFTGA